MSIHQSNCILDDDSDYDSHQSILLSTVWSQAPQHLNQKVRFREQPNCTLTGSQADKKGTETTN